MFGDNKKHNVTIVVPDLNEIKETLDTKVDLMNRRLGGLEKMIAELSANLSKQGQFGFA